MAYDDLEDDELDDQDKPKPKPQAPPQAIGTPIQPTTGTPVGSPDSGRFQDVRPIQAPPQQSSTAIAPIMPDAGVAPQSNSSIGTPIVPSAPIGPVPLGQQETGRLLWLHRVPPSIMGLTSSSTL